ncbi:MAG: SDR family oxidoreductase [Deltaproteobacteria bacterium]|nr:SDR family oxidoreductase [Deltaproteobacteria bacterium]
MRALITGAGVRLGRATALQLAQAGFDLTLHVHRSRDGAEAVAAEARALGRDVQILQADLSRPEDCARLAAETLAAGPLDALVNNAALYERRALAEITLADWRDAAAERATILSTVPLAREGRALDIAAAVVFLITQAPYVTGHTLNVDGGRLVSQLSREG